MAEQREVRRGYEQFVAPQAPPGMYFDPSSELFLPRGVRLASRAEVAGAWFLGLALFIGTLGIGYVTWSLFEWGCGRTPAQRMLGLRCWLPGSRQVAGRQRTAERQVIGFCLNGQLLSGLFVWLTSKNLRSVGDFFAGTVLIHAPDGVLRLPPARRRSGHVLASLVVVAGLLVAVAATFAWLAMVVTGLSRAEETRFLPRPAWVLLCLFSPVGAVVYLAVSRAWRRRVRPDV